MITDDKIKEVKRRLNRGEPEGEIKETLKREGYSEEDIAKVFKPHYYDMRTWYLAFAIILLFVGIWLFLIQKSLLGLIFSALLFLSYYWEVQRLKNIKKKE